MAKNFLAKTRVFVPLVISAGYELHVPASGDLDREQLNGSEIAALTQNASYLLTGTGSLDTDDGSSLVYSRVPLRDGEKITDISQGSGAMLLTVPKIGSRQAALTANGKLTTSPLTHVFARKPIPQSQPVEGVGETINASFHKINMQTLYHR